MLAHEHTYGFGSALSREVQVSRQTLSTWKAQARAALEQTFADTASTTVVTLLVEGHRSYATIQVCLRRVTGQSVSIGTIAAVVQEAQARAMAWMATHAPTSTRALALDEISANQRRGVCLRVVDSDRWAVWAAEGPLPADAERWTLVRWLAQDRGLRWQSLVTDGGEALSADGRTVDPTRRAGRDQWPVFHTISQVQHRLARQLRTLEERTPTVARQAARIAAGKPPRGKEPDHRCGRARGGDRPPDPDGGGTARLEQHAAGGPGRRGGGSHGPAGCLGASGRAADRPGTVGRPAGDRSQERARRMQAATPMGGWRPPGR